MLVLTRKKDEIIVIDGRITIQVLRIKGGTIRLGIEAPREVPIRRAEIEPLAPLEGEKTPAPFSAITSSTA